MDRVGYLVQAADYSLATYFLLMIGVLIWSFAGRVPSDRKKHYSRRVLVMSQMPFAYQWRHSIAPDDLLLFEQARMRHLIALVLALALPFLLAVYAYINAASLLWLCNAH